MFTLLLLLLLLLLLVVIIIFEERALHFQQDVSDDGRLGQCELDTCSIGPRHIEEQKRAVWRRLAAAAAVSLSHVTGSVINIVTAGTLLVATAVAVAVIVTAAALPMSVSVIGDIAVFVVVVTTDAAVAVAVAVTGSDNPLELTDALLLLLQPSLEPFGNLQQTATSLQPLMAIFQ